jgi:hypothetical protein
MTQELVPEEVLSSSQGISTSSGEAMKELMKVAKNSIAKGIVCEVV